MVVTENGKELSGQMVSQPGSNDLSSYLSWLILFQLFKNKSFFKTYILKSFFQFSNISKYPGKQLMVGGCVKFSLPHNSSLYLIPGCFPFFLPPPCLKQVREGDSLYYPIAIRTAQWSRDHLLFQPVAPAISQIPYVGGKLISESGELLHTQLQDPMNQTFSREGEWKQNLSWLFL